MSVDEADRQRQLLAALLADQADAGSLTTRGPGARALRGLQAYRANAHASASRALASAFPTVQLLVGEDDFDRLARDFWHAHPPLRGDLGEWGGAFPGWVAADARLADWPYLGDCAQLDWALHVCERAADAELDAPSMARLGDTDPARLVIELAPGLALIASAWPIATLHAAHHGGDDAAFEQAREAIRAARAETVVVARHGWKAVPAVVEPATAAWTQQMLEGRDLGSALAQAPQDFDFGAWLARALQAGWVKGIRVLVID